MSVPIKVTSYIYGDNMSVIYNTSRPESMLRNKPNIICYHFLMEAVASKVCLTSHITTLKNQERVYETDPDTNMADSTLVVSLKARQSNPDSQRS